MVIDELQPELDEICNLVEAKHFTELKAKLIEMEIHDLAALLRASAWIARHWCENDNVRKTIMIIGGLNDR